MKKRLWILGALILLLSGCSQTEEDLFRFNKDGNLVSPAGVEYTYLTNEEEGFCCLGNFEFAGSVEGEEKTSQHLSNSYQTGIFAIKGAENDNLLIRQAPKNEWKSIYRKASLSAFDISVDHCIRLKLISGRGEAAKDDINSISEDGITERSEVTAFLSEVRMQKDPEEAGLYDLVRKSDGMFENCYEYGVVYGFFEEEPDLAFLMPVTSYNDLAYSISIGDKAYVLPSEWLQKLENR